MNLNRVYRIDVATGTFVANPFCEVSWVDHALKGPLTLDGECLDRHRLRNIHVHGPMCMTVARVCILTHGSC